MRISAFENSRHFLRIRPRNVGASRHGHPFTPHRLRQSRPSHRSLFLAVDSAKSGGAKDILGVRDGAQAPLAPPGVSAVTGRVYAAEGLDSSAHSPTPPRGSGTLGIIREAAQTLQIMLHMR